MAAFTLYDASIGQSKDACDSFLSILNKIESSSVASTVLTARLHPDMLPFNTQVDIFSNTVGKMVARITGAEPSEITPVEVDLGAMKNRINEIKAKLEGASKETVNSREAETVSVGLGKDRPDGKLPSWAYVAGYAMPNIYFHLVTAYDIARKEGVEVGKMDYLASFLAPKLQ